MTTTDKDVPGASAEVMEFLCAEVPGFIDWLHDGALLNAAWTEQLWSLGDWVVDGLERFATDDVVSQYVDLHPEGRRSYHRRGYRDASHNATGRLRGSIVAAVARTLRDVDRAVIADCQHTATEFAADERRPALSWAHHHAVAFLQDRAQRTRVLDFAELHGLSSEECNVAALRINRGDDPFDPNGRLRDLRHPKKRRPEPPGSNDPDAGDDDTTTVDHNAEREMLERFCSIARPAVAGGVPVMIPPAIAAVVLDLVTDVLADQNATTTATG